MARGAGPLTVPPGWYPDPDDPDRFRYFDGAEWTGRFAADAQGRPIAGPRRPRGRTVAITALVATVVAVLITAWVVIFRAPALPALDSSGGFSDGPTQSADGSPFTGDGRPCPVGNPGRRADHPDDGRVYGGSLSFSRLNDYSPPATDQRLTFARDVQQQAKVLHANAAFETPGWATELIVGQVRTRDGFPPTAELTTLKILDCLGRSALYRGLRPQIKITQSGSWGLGQAENGGGTARQLTAQILVSIPRAGFVGDQVTIAVMPDATSDQTDWSFFISTTPIGAAEATEQARLTLDSLQSA